MIRIKKTLMQSLIDKVSGQGREQIVILKIATKNLDQKILRIRSQNQLLKWNFLTDEPNRHIIDGDNVNFSKKYKQQKHAIEYIYQDDIPIKYVEKIGEINPEQIRAAFRYNKNNPIQSVFTELLKGTPEEKGAKLLSL